MSPTSENSMPQACCILLVYTTIISYDSFEMNSPHNNSVLSRSMTGESNVTCLCHSECTKGVITNSINFYNYTAVIRNLAMIIIYE